MLPATWPTRIRKGMRSESASLLPEVLVGDQVGLGVDPALRLAADDPGAVVAVGPVHVRADLDVVALVVIQGRDHRVGGAQARELDLGRQGALVGRS